MMSSLDEARGAIVYVLLGGHALLASIVVILTLLLRDVQRSWRRVEGDRSVSRTATALATGVAIVGGSSVPLWLSLAALALVAAWLVAGSRGSAAILRVTAAMLGAVLVTIGLLEAKVFFSDRVADCDAARLVVLGDSLASGGFGERTTWPDLVAESMGIPLDDRSAPSERISTATIEDGVVDGDLVVVALGGNDMLEGVAPDLFEEGAEHLIGRLLQSTDRVVWLEIPAIPGRSGHLRVQRRVASRLGVPLIPRRVTLAALTRRGSTFDGIHLTTAGHRDLARRIARALGCERDD